MKLKFLIFFPFWKAWTRRRETMTLLLNCTAGYCCDPHRESSTPTSLPIQLVVSKTPPTGDYTSARLRLLVLPETRPSILTKFLNALGDTKRKLFPELQESDVKGHVSLCWWTRLRRTLAMIWLAASKFLLHHSCPAWQDLPQSCLLMVCPWGSEETLSNPWCMPTSMLVLPVGGIGTGWRWWSGFWGRVNLVTTKVAPILSSRQKIASYLDDGGLPYVALGGELALCCTGWWASPVAPVMTMNSGTTIPLT